MPRIPGSPITPRRAEEPTAARPVPKPAPPAIAQAPLDRFEAGASAGAGDVRGAAVGAVQLPPGLGTLFPAGQAGRALWVWDETGGKLPDPELLMSACRQMGVSQIYVNAYPPSGAHLEQLEQIVTLAARQGIEAQLLCGDAAWTDPPTRPWISTQVLQPLQAMLARVREQNPGLELSSALHLDVEPQAGGMTAQKAEAYVEMLSWFRAQLGDALPLAADVPGWFADASWTAGGRPLGEAILDHVDQLTLMAYSKDPGAVVGLAAPLVEAASGRGKKVVVGVETRPSTENVHLVSQEQARDALAQVDGAFAGRDASRGYSGLAIHDFASLLTLVP
ncbi:MAG TPA: hypothetical protein VGK67_33115 [Myxococcales bacterium]|jgi:hypothetical protein